MGPMRMGVPPSRHMRCIARGNNVEGFILSSGAHVSIFGAVSHLGVWRRHVFPYVSSTCKALGARFFRGGLTAFLERTVSRGREAWSGLFEEGLRSSGEESRLPCGCDSLPELLLLRKNWTLPSMSPRGGGMRHFDPDRI